MCGIAGTLGLNPGGAWVPTHLVEGMLTALTHRGPDDAGIWSDAERAVCFGTRRLAIVDTSAAGHQPMHSSSGRFVVAMNGEIYNHRALRRQIDAGTDPPAWRGTSDTEVLVRAIEAWGIDATLQACVGMFAIAIWDRDERRLTLGRDRIGEKPLYFGRFGGAWLFGSELKALATHPLFCGALDPAAVSAYMALGYVPAPASIYAKVRKVRPATLVTISADDDTPHERVYWSAYAVANRPKRTFARDVDAIDELETLLERAVGEQMVADRPIGALLSGGIDSSTIVALMQRQRSGPIRTFSIGFEQSTYNEALHAARVAAHFGTEHTELYIGEQHVRDTIPLLPQIYDEPFADISQIPTFLVSRLAAGKVTVALTGDGGDELFGGYPRYAMGARLWPTVRRVPRAWRPAIGALLCSAPPAIDHAFTWAFPHDEVTGTRGLRPVQKLGKLGRAFRSADLGALYWQLLAPWSEPALLRSPRIDSPFPSDAGELRTGSVAEHFMLRDLVGYLPDGILTKIDRAAMAVSLESRAPLLDHRIVEFALQLPHGLMFRAGVGKWLLREVLFRDVPKALVDRPKMGFVVPIASWLRGPLKPWAHDLIATSHGDVAGMLDLGAMAAMLDRHAAGTGDWHQPLWTGLMFLDWARHTKPRSAAARHDASATRAGDPRAARAWRIETAV